MPEYDNTNSGALFKNDKKTTKNHPDMKGSINVGGVDYWIAAWKKVSKAGQGYVSLSVEPKEQQAPPQQQRSYGGGQDHNAPRPQQQNLEPLDDDDIPF